MSESGIQRIEKEKTKRGGYDATPTNRYGQPIESFWSENSERPVAQSWKPKPPQDNDTILPAGRFNVAPFGPTGVINNNSLDTVGQGLKKVFAQPVDAPRQFNAGPETQPKGGVGQSADGGGGGGGDLPEGTTTKVFDVCENGTPTEYTFLIVE